YQRSCSFQNNVRLIRDNGSCPSYSPYCHVRSPISILSRNSRKTCSHSSTDTFFTNGQPSFSNRTKFISPNAAFLSFFMNTRKLPKLCFKIGANERKSVV